MSNLDRSLAEWQRTVKEGRPLNERLAKLKELDSALITIIARTNELLKK